MTLTIYKLYQFVIDKTTQRAERHLHVRGFVDHGVSVLKQRKATKVSKTTWNVVLGNYKEIWETIWANTVVTIFFICRFWGSPFYGVHVLLILKFVMSHHYIMYIVTAWITNNQMKPELWAYLSYLFLLNASPPYDSKSDIRATHYNSIKN